MRPIAELSAALAARPLGVFTDIDDTLTTGGRLSAAVYAALERLQAGGVGVVPVTGRPAGWCDMIARFWPVDGVVGENGAFYFRYDRAERRMIRRYAIGADARGSSPRFPAAPSPPIKRIANLISRSILPKMSDRFRKRTSTRSSRRSSLPARPRKSRRSTSTAGSAVTIRRA
jgi:hypothetical protein